jgi:hypothetical protein
LVVVLMVLARTAVPAGAAGRGFDENTRAWNIGDILADARTLTPVSPPGPDIQPSAFTTASPIWLVPTLVVPSL